MHVGGGRLVKLGGMNRNYFCTHLRCLDAVLGVVSTHNTRTNRGMRLFIYRPSSRDLDFTRWHGRHFVGSRLAWSIHYPYQHTHTSHLQQLTQIFPPVAPLLCSFLLLLLLRWSLSGWNGVRRVFRAAALKLALRSRWCCLCACSL